MGIMQQLQNGEYSTSPKKLATVTAAGGYKDSSFMLEQLEVEGNYLDVVTLLAVATAHVLSTENSSKLVEGFLVQLQAALRAIKQEESKPNKDEE